MSSQPIADSLVSLNQFCDYCPLVSTVTQCVKIALKVLFAHILPEGHSLKDNYFVQYLEKQTYGRCATLLIPLIGCSIVWHREDDMKKEILEEERTLPLEELLKKCEPHFFDDDCFMQNMIRSKPSFFTLASPRLRDDSHIAELAMEREPNMYYFASSHIKKLKREIGKGLAMRSLFLSSEFSDDEEVALHAIKINPSNMARVSEKLKDTAPFMAKAIAIDPRFMRDASDRLQQDDDFIVENATKQPLLLCYAAGDVRNNLNLMGKLIAKDWRFVRFLSEEIMDNQEALETLSEINPCITEILNQIDEELLLFVQEHIHTHPER